MYKRGELRRELHLPVEVILSDWDSPVRLEISDLSPAGAYVESDYLPDAGQPLVFCFGLNRIEDYWVFASVRRVNPLRRRIEMGRPGFGIEFQDLPPLERLRLRQRLRGLPPPVPRPSREEDPIHLGWLC